MIGARALLAGVLAAGLAGSASPSPTSPSPGRADPELMAQAQESLAEDLAQLGEVTITPQMRAASTIDLAGQATFTLVPEPSSWDLRPDDSTTALETVVEEGEQTTVRLTSDLLFDFGQATLTAPASAAVAELAATIPQGVAVAVDGHTDSVGDDALNDELSQRRAEAVAAVLTQARPDLALTVTGHGEQEPVADNEVDGNDNPAGRAQNRRVEVSYESPGT